MNVNKTFGVRCLFALCSFAVLLLVGCSKEEKVSLVSPASVESKVEAGWADYAAGRYEAAAVQFESVLTQDASYLDAYNGLGWSSFRQGEFAEAIDYFEFLLPLRDSEPALAADAYAGLAAVYMTQNEDVHAIISAWEVLSIAGESYVFTHDPSITAEDIHILLARSIYNTGEFYLSQVEISAVDSTFPPPSLIPTSTVIETVEATDSVDIYLSFTDAFPTLVLPTHVGNVILVSSVTDTLGQVHFDVIYAYGEGGDIFVTSETLPPIGTPFIVEYTYVEDYFEYLIRLAKKIESLAAF